MHLGKKLCRNIAVSVMCQSEAVLFVDTYKKLRQKRVNGGEESKGKEVF